MVKIQARSPSNFQAALFVSAMMSVVEDNDNDTFMMEFMKAEAFVKKYEGMRVTLMFGESHVNHFVLY